MGTEGRGGDIGLLSMTVYDIPFSSDTIALYDSPRLFPRVSSRGLLFAGTQVYHVTYSIV